MELLIKNVYVQNEHIGKKKNKANEAKTIENIKYTPITSQLVL